MAVDLRIENGTIVTADRTFEAALAVDDGRIAAVGDSESIPAGETTVDATGQYVMPGVVDPHVHIDDALDRIGTYESESRAAALGGVTTFMDFAWQGGDRATASPDEGLVDGIRHKQQKGASALVDFGLHAAVTMERESVLEEFADAVEAGVTSFKAFMSTYSVGVSNGFIDRVMRRAADHDAVVMVHTEDPSVCDHRAEQFRAEGKDDPVWFARSRPAYAEAMAAEDAVRMALAADAKYYGVHTSSRAAVEVISHLQRKHDPDRDQIRAETCPQYCLLDESAHEEWGNLAKIAPSLKSPDDRAAMFEHLESGALSAVGTDHVAYHRDSKAGMPWWESPFGVNGLQWSLPLMYDALVERREFSPSFVVRKLCTAPAHLFGMPWKGSLDPGTDADLVLFDPDATRTVTAGANASNADYSVYEGRELTGVVSDTFVRGERVVADGEVVGTPGHGEFVECAVPDWANVP